jgi:hypothetical protein
MIDATDISAIKTTEKFRCLDSWDRYAVEEKAPQRPCGRTPPGVTSAATLVNEMPQLKQTAKIKRNREGFRH